MLFSSISPGGAELQLPGLTPGALSTAYFDNINAFYELNLSPADYQPSQVFVGSDNLAKLDLVPVSLNVNNDILRFTSRKATVISTTQPVNNALSTIMVNYLPQSPAWVNVPSDLTFLKDVPLNTPRNIFSAQDVTPHLLATLLNGIPEQPTWSDKMDGTYSTAGFSVSYYGSVDTAPSTNLYPDAAVTVVILNILRGSNTGTLMLCVS